MSDPYQSECISSSLFMDSLVSSSDCAESVISGSQSSKWLTFTSLDEYWKLKQSYQVKVSKISDDSVFIEIIKETANDLVEERTLPISLFRGHQLAVGNFFIINYYERSYAVMITAYPSRNVNLNQL